MENKTKENKKDELLEDAWKLIATGRRMGATKEWRNATIKWRDKYHKL